MDTDSSRAGSYAYTKVSLLIVADVRLYREGLHSGLSRREHLTVLGEAGSHEAALALVASTDVDMVILDMATKDSLAIARAISREAASVKIIAFGVEELDRDIFACAEAGVAAWVPCEGSIDDLVATIDSVARDELVCSARMAATLFRRLASLAKRRPQPAAASPLTGREREIAVLVERGLSNKEIAQRLNIEVSTVKNHIHNILGKLHVATRAEAAASRRSQGLSRGTRSIVSDDVTNQQAQA